MNSREPKKSESLEYMYALGTYGTKFVWNSLRSTLRLPSKRKDAVTLETTWAMRRLRLTNDGDCMFKFFLQIS